MAQVYSESMPVADILVRTANRFPDRTALALPDTQYTYSELLEGAYRVARGLTALGVQRGDTVGLLAPNSLEFLEGFFGTLLIGGVSVPMNARYRSSELAYVVDHAQMAAVLTTDSISHHVDFAARLGEAFGELQDSDPEGPLTLADAPHLQHVVMLRGRARGCVSQDAFATVSEEVSTSDVDRLKSLTRVRDDAVILYTSGTTAHPKGCVISHEALSRGPVGRIAEVTPEDKPDDVMVMWCPAPIFHVAALQGVILCIAHGGTLVTDIHLEGARALDSVKRYRATTLWPMFMPAMNALMDAPGFRASDLSDVSSIVTVGTPSELRHIQDLFPQALFLNGSGMTETVGHFALSPLEDGKELRATTSGKPVSGAELRVVDPDTGAELPADTVGELLVRGYMLLTRYHRDPEKTREAIDEHGWLHTGDLFRQLPSGHFRYEGRLKDMLKVGGENVPPVEVEALLSSHPAISVAAVVGRPDPRLDEVPVAFVETRPGYSVSASELIEYCARRIASFKVPRQIYFKSGDEWPMSATKINKVALRSESSD